MVVKEGGGAEVTMISCSNSRATLFSWGYPVLVTHLISSSALIPHKSDFSKWYIGHQRSQRPLV